MSVESASDAVPEVSVVAPVLNEEAAAPALAREIAAAFAGRDVEIIFVDDASVDDTRQALLALKPELPQLRVLWHGHNAGQSRAIRTGVLAARASIVVMLDGDGQNDPADAPALVEALRAAEPSVGLVGGERRERRDAAARRLASRLANAVRRRLLDDGAADTGCGLKAFRREVFLRLPYFDHMHRYLPALVLREGYAVAFQPVGHRPRMSGRSKYSNLGRLVAALPDLGGVLWLRARGRATGPVGEG
ncbi:MAG TPA: glycosyltransferase family 2 protein [Caulobacteraceae bacterium]